MNGAINAEVLLVAWLVTLLFNHTVLKHFLLKRLCTHHPEVWQKMGEPGIFSFRESHWTLVGIAGDFPLCAELESDAAGRKTRSQIYRYRLASAIEVIVVLAAFLTLYAELPEKR